MSLLCSFMSTEGIKSVSWPWISHLRGWGSLTMSFTGKFPYIGHYFILLRLKFFDLQVDTEGQLFERSMS